MKPRSTPEEKESIKNWVLEIQSWRFLRPVTQLQEMAKELLQARHDFKELGTNWTSKFLNCYPVLQSKYSHTLDQDRFLAQNCHSIQQWFDLYWSIKAKQGILNEDTYNMDGNGYMMFITGLQRGVFEIPETSVYKPSVKSGMSNPY